MNFSVSKKHAKKIWIQAQKLDQVEPFGSGPEATKAAIEHLGYVQIDTIHVIERCHHHILFNRIPQYRRSDLFQAQSIDKTVFEYWAHALAYLPTRDFQFFMNDMKRMERNPSQWYSGVKKADFQKVIRLIQKDGPISIRDIQDDVLVEKDHEWASRKPSKKALQFGFYSGKLVVSERVGMLKKYELADRHFHWNPKPKAATESQIIEYLLTRSLRSQGLVSLDSICYLDAKRKPAVKKQIERWLKQKELVEVRIDGFEKAAHWVRPEVLEQRFEDEEGLTHLLSPFDPLVIQRKRLEGFFDYEHRFEAYLPKEKRKYGYFALPVLVGDQIVAALDLKTDREKKKVLMQKWSWMPKMKSAALKTLIEAELDRFETFQLAPR